MACVVQQKDARQWFAELSVDMEKVDTFSFLATDLLCNGKTCMLATCPHVKW